MQIKDYKNHQNLSELEKNRKRQYACERYRKFFIETEFSEEDKTKMVHMRAIFVKKRKVRKDKKHEYATKQYKNLLMKKNTKSVNMYATYMETFLKSSEKKKLYLLWTYNKLDFYKKQFSFKKFSFQVSVRDFFGS